MKKYLYMKFILAIILLGLLGFSAISLAGGKLVQEHVETIYSEELYREASHIAQDPLIRSYRTIDNQATVYKDLCTLSAYQNSSIWQCESYALPSAPSNCVCAHCLPAAYETLNPEF